MNKFLIFGLLVMAGMAVNAEPPAVNTIAITYQKEAWVTTVKPIVTIQIESHAKSSNNLYNTINHQLTTLYPDQSIKWHIFKWQQVQDSADLEHVSAQVQGRLPQSALENLSDKMKTLSKPGLSYSLQSVQYTPSLADVEKVHAGLREALYTVINQEVTRINKIYPKKPYHVSRIYFTGSPETHSLMGAMHKSTLLQLSKPLAQVNQSMAVGQKVIETASVQLSTE